MDYHSASTNRQDLATGEGPESRSKVPRRLPATGPLSHDAGASAAVTICARGATLRPTSSNLPAAAEIGQRRGRPRRMPIAAPCRGMARAAHGSSKRRQSRHPGPEEWRAPRPGSAARRGSWRPPRATQRAAASRSHRCPRSSAPRQPCRLTNRGGAAAKRITDTIAEDRRKLEGSAGRPARRCRYPCTFPPATESAVPPRALPALPSLRFLTRPRASRSGEGR